MTSRDEILAGVRRALAQADRSTPEVPRGYRENRERSAADLLALFVERVDDYRATVTCCTAE